jgi:hypothetical protein
VLRQRYENPAVISNRDASNFTDLLIQQPAERKSVAFHGAKTVSPLGSDGLDLHWNCMAIASDFLFFSGLNFFLLPGPFLPLPC